MSNLLQPRRYDLMYPQPRDLAPSSSVYSYLAARPALVGELIADSVGRLSVPGMTGNQAA